MSAKFPILLVDDDPDIADILNRAATHTFPEAVFTHARSYAEAVAYLDGMERRIPSLILLGINLQTEPSGFDFLGLVRQHATGSLIPIVMLTASSGQDIVLKAYNLKANACTIKPFTYEGWKEYVAQLRSYWFSIVTTPELYLSS